MPWVGPEGGRGDDNFTPLASLDWQVHVYGVPAPRLEAICAERGLPLHVYSWRARMADAGLAPDAYYLLRSDGYVALAKLGSDGTGDSAVDALVTYIETHGLRFR